jgi:hypothetical protein
VKLGSKHELAWLRNKKSWSQIKGEMHEKDYSSLTGNGAGIWMLLTGCEIFDYSSSSCPRCFGSKLLFIVARAAVPGILAASVIAND